MDASLRKVTKQMLVLEVFFYIPVFVAMITWRIGFLSGMMFGMTMLPLGSAIDWWAKKRAHVAVCASLIGSSILTLGVLAIAASSAERPADSSVREIALSAQLVAFANVVLFFLVMLVPTWKERYRVRRRSLGH